VDVVKWEDASHSRHAKADAASVDSALRNALVDSKVARKHEQLAHVPIADGRSASHHCKAGEAGQMLCAPTPLATAQPPTPPRPHRGGKQVDFADSGVWQRCGHANTFGARVGTASDHDQCNRPPSHEQPKGAHMLSPRTKATKCVNNTQMPVLHDVCGRGVVKNARFTCYASQSTQCRQESRTIAEQQPPPRLAHE